MEKQVIALLLALVLLAALTDGISSYFDFVSRTIYE